MNGTLLIATGIIVLVTVITAFIVMQGRKTAKKNRDKMGDLYRNIIATNDLKISEELILDDKIFALDAHSKTFVFVYNHDEPSYDTIHLQGMKGCMVKKAGTNLTSTKNGKSFSETHINEIHLSFLMGSNVAVTVPVYSEIHDGISQYLPLLAVAQDWQHKLNALIKPHARAEPIA